MPRIFTLGEAQALLPRLSALLAAAVECKRSYDAAETSVRSSLQRITLMGGMNVDPSAAGAERRRLEAAAASLRQAMAAIDAIGCQVKDLDIGLIDFPSLYRSEEVCLCWKLGEPEILHWHRADEGFTGRKPVDADFSSNHGS
jgi:hypothetical protein